jgi:hypothetical protein
MKKFMTVRSSFFILHFSVILWGIMTMPVLALGECGFSCCIAGANTSGVTLAPNFGLSLQYEYMDMETIRHGRDKVGPNTTINKHWQKGSSYSIPTKMIMQKWSLVTAYPITARFQVIGMLPYLKNDMDMRMKNPMGMVMNTTMDTIQGLGDVSAMGFYTIYADAPIRPRQRLTAGFGLKMPTGKNDEKNAAGKYVHTMMQLGSGSWDGLFTVNYLKASYPLIFQASLFYQLNTEGDEGYEFGDQLSYDLVSRYQTGLFFNIGMDLHGIYAWKDKDHEGKFSRVANSMLDNADNSGLHSIFLTPVLQFKIPNTGGSLELKYQKPLYQDVNGYQQVIDSRWLMSLTWNF